MSLEKIPEVLAAAQSREIRRLTHFTPSRNLPRILIGQQIESTETLRSNGRHHAHTDAERLDGRLTHICCNIEYPNMYYFRYASQRQVNYSDWCVLLIEPSLVAREGNLFSPVNAAKGSGAYLAPGVAGFNNLYAPSVNGNSRTTTHWRASPTDVQAEVLINGSIPVSEIVGIIVPSEVSLRRERRRLELIAVDPNQFGWYTSPGMFQRENVRRAVQRSQDIEIVGPFGAAEEQI